MEYSAIYHDMDKRFCYAIDKDLFVIRVQVKKDDMKEIILHCEDKYIPMERKDTKKTILMKKIATSQFHDYYDSVCAASNASAMSCFAANAATGSRKSTACLMRVPSTRTRRHRRN